VLVVRLGLAPTIQERCQGRIVNVLCVRLLDQLVEQLPRDARVDEGLEIPPRLDEDVSSGSRVLHPGFPFSSFSFLFLYLPLFS
jgi:hypothetical protein